METSCLLGTTLHFLLSHFHKGYSDSPASISTALHTHFCSCGSHTGQHLSDQMLSTDTLSLVVKHHLPWSTFQKKIMLMSVPKTFQTTHCGYSVFSTGFLPKYFVVLSESNSDCVFKYYLHDKTSHLCIFVKVPFHCVFGLKRNLTLI